MNSDAKFRKKIKGEQLTEFFLHIKSQVSSLDDIMFVCIGTDCSTGDALGPLVGTFLAESGYANVVGTLAYPCDASNLIGRMKEIDANKIVIAIDACLGQAVSVGSYQVSNQPIEPGRSVGKLLPGVGDYGIAGIVNADGARKYSILQHTSLYKVLTMAKEIAAAIREAFPNLPISK